MDYRLFATTEQLRMAREDIQRYQIAYRFVNGKPILVKWMKGWFAIGSSPASVRFVRPTQFRNMTDELERRFKEQ